MGKSKKKPKKYSSSSSSDRSSSSSSDSSSSSSSSSDHRSKKRQKKHKRKHSRSKKSKQTTPNIKLMSKPVAIGPVLPQELSKSVQNDANVDIGPDLYGPVLPLKLEDPQQIGPALPPHMMKPKTVAGPPPKIKDDTFGPSLPPNLQPGFDNQDDGDVVGPLPEGMGGESSTQRALEMRAKYLKHEMENQKNASDNTEPQREEWMLELPPESTVILGLGPRSFRSKEGPDMSRRSEWTETPTDKVKRQQKLLMEGGEPPPNPEEERRKFQIEERDKAMQKMIEKCKKSKKHKRDKSLYEIHQDKLKKKQKKKDKERGDKPPERRPFDRDIDLQANRFDEAQRKSIVNKAQLLDTRFSTGESKFL